MAVQLELFERSATDILTSRVNTIETQVGNVRRGMFQRHDELERQTRELRQELEKLKIDLEDAKMLLKKPIETMKISENSIKICDGARRGIFLLH